MEIREERSMGQRLVHASCGAFLAALIGIAVHFWWADIHWWVVGACAAFGFVLGWVVGDEAIDFLKSIFWWT